MSVKLTGEQQLGLLRRLGEIEKQIWLKEYPYDPVALKDHLQAAIEGCFAKPKWVEKDGVITFTLPKTEGISGEAWITRLEAKKGIGLGIVAKQILRSSDFKPTNGEVYIVKILMGDRLFDIEGRTTKNIRAYAKENRLKNLNAEAACLIREYFTNEELNELGLNWIAVMHEPIKTYGVDINLLVVEGNIAPYLQSCSGMLDCRWGRNNGFAFREVA